ncbi:hypothetical protein [Flavobacterium sp. LM4]|uniref:hypothetical protein n=1 Tax=Flavobacterium sp. LM4 TaxID=1938609 RepID=UPI000F504664|nr:hypothetical protein [Flavobacterium sp. LM4]
MKKIYFLAILCIVFTSCSKDDSSNDPNSITKEEIKLFNFPSEEKMEEKIDEIITLKSERKQIVLFNFNESEASKGFTLNSKKTNDLDVKKRDKAIKNSLKIYHTALLSSIYELRKELNFTSIQSIADEINSLNATDPNKAKLLTEIHQKLLIRDPLVGIIKTVFNERVANIINIEGEVIIEGKKVNYKENFSTSNQTQKYIGDEFIVGELAGFNDDYKAYYFAGREVHKNDLGVKFFKYYTELKTYMGSFPAMNVVECPSVFTVQDGSKAGFAQSKDNPFSDYAFSYPFISGTGVSVRYRGGNKNTAYVPVGGNLKATFTTTLGGVFKEINVDLVYKE